MKAIGILVLLFSMSASLTATAAVSNQTKNALKNSGILRGSGSIRGGLAGRGYSLLGVKSQVAKNKKLERLVVGVGDGQFQNYKGAPGYFHIENSADLKRVVLNFAQTPNSKFDEKALKKVFAQSPFVKNSEMLFDPQTQTTSLVLHLKKSASVRVVPVSGTEKRMAQLRVDLFEDSLLKGKK